MLAEELLLVGEVASRTAGVQDGTTCCRRLPCCVVNVVCGDNRLQLAENTTLAAKHFEGRDWSAKDTAILTELTLGHFNQQIDIFVMGISLVATSRWIRGASK